MWRTEAEILDPAQVVFLDETSTHTSLCRRYARAPRGLRAYGPSPATTVTTSPCSPP